MAKIIAVTNQKGGVGKTTTSVNLSACLGELGRKVFLIDFDPQGNATSGLGQTAPKNSVYEAIMNGVNINDCIIKTQFANLSLLPADIRLAGAELELASVANREYVLKNILFEVSKVFDEIIIDCPPSLNLLTINALSAANSVIVPIQCEYYALEGVTSLINTITRVRQAYNLNLDIEGILLTMLDGRTNLSLQVVESVKKHFKNKVFKTAISRNVRLGEAPSHGLPISVYDSRSFGAENYKNLAIEYLTKNKISYKWGKIWQRKVLDEV